MYLQSTVTILYTHLTPYQSVSACFNTNRFTPILRDGKAHMRAYEKYSKAQMCAFQYKNNQFRMDASSTVHSQYQYLILNVSSELACSCLAFVVILAVVFAFRGRTIVATSA